MSLDAAFGLGLVFLAITIGDVLLDRLWNRIWKRPPSNKPQDPWTDRTGL